MLDPLPVGREDSPSVQSVDRLIEIAMRAAQLFWHDVWIVKVGECRICIFGKGAGIEDGLRQCLHLRALGGRGVGPGETVIDEADGVAITALQLAADVPHPCHVNGAGEQAEFPHVGIGWWVQRVAATL